MVGTSERLTKRVPLALWSAATHAKQKHGAQVGLGGEGACQRLKKPKVRALRGAQGASEAPRSQLERRAAATRTTRVTRPTPARARRSRAYPSERSEPPLVASCARLSASGAPRTVCGYVASVKNRGRRVRGSSGRAQYRCRRRLSPFGSAAMDSINESVLHGFALGAPYKPPAQYARGGGGGGALLTVPLQGWTAGPHLLVF